MKRESDRRKRRKPDRKQRQLCGQVGQAIDLALGASGDPLLQGCWVVDVRPAPTQARLCVRVQTGDSVHVRELEERLQRAAAWLRSEVAAFICRSKTPHLDLVWAGPEEPE